MRQSLRFQILERDQFRCRYCGAEASETVKLQVDHVYPRSQGGTNEESNLVTACWDCNSGKGARVLLPVPPRKKYKTLGRRYVAASPDEEALELEGLRQRFGFASHCTTPLKIAATGLRFGCRTYAASYRFVKQIRLPEGMEVPMPPQRRSDAVWFRVVQVDDRADRELANILERALGDHPEDEFAARPI